jgi:hypothetical protein
MRVMVIVKADANSETGQMASAELLAAMMSYNEELVKAGVMLSGEGLRPSSQGVRVRFSGDRRSVIDGPFPETRELVAGFWIWNVDSMASAIEWVKRCPNPQVSDSDIEIRPVVTMEDFAQVMTPEIEAQDARLRQQLKGQGG